MQRSPLRDRPYERNMESAYIEMLNQSYDQFYGAGGGEAMTITIECNDLDFVANEKDLNHIEERVRQTLKLTPFQSELPLNLVGGE